MAKKWPEDLDEFTKVLGHVKAGIVIADSDTTILWANPYYQELTKLDIFSFIGRSTTDLVSGSGEILYSDKYETMFEEVCRTKRDVTTAIKYLTEDYLVTIASPVLDEAQEVKYVVYTVSNYDDIVRIQQDLSDAYARIAALQSYHNGNFQEIQGDQDIVCENPLMRKIYAAAGNVAKMPASIMLLGESGTGKDVLARYIHRSSRHEGPFVHVNLGAIPDSLFESELFGYEAGAFTGALKTGKAGLIELADGGTLFLDEIGEMPLDMQAKLLQVLQDRTVRKVGGTREIPVDIRVICATNRDLNRMVEEGTFRLDLFYRLNVVDFRIPPLRERKQDIVPLAMMFLKQYNEQYHCSKLIMPEVLDALTQYSWPGNIRELRHLIERLVVAGRSDRIGLELLPAEVSGKSRQTAELIRSIGDDLTLKEAVAQFEEQYISRALREAKNSAAAASRLGIDNSTLSKKRKKYGI